MEHPEFRKSKEDSEQDGIKSLCTGKETHVYLWLIYVDAWQKPTQYCKAIILQLKKKNFFQSLCTGKNRNVENLPDL